MAGFGFDAAVAREALQTNFMGYRGRAILYLLALAKMVFLYKKSDAIVTVDGRKLKLSDVLSICIANGKYHGGGYLQAPEADCTDGLLDVTIISGISKWGVFRNIKNLYDGSFVNDPSVTLEKGRSFSIDSKLPIDVEIDGELLGYPFREISILPNVIRFIIP
jgi:diacylglycerol kinase family enzyme